MLKVDKIKYWFTYCLFPFLECFDSWRFVMFDDDYNISEKYTFFQELNFFASSNLLAESYWDWYDWFTTSFRD